MAETKVGLRVVNVAVERVTFEASIGRAEVRERLKPGDTVRAVLQYETPKEEKKRVDREEAAEKKEEEKAAKAPVAPAATVKTETTTAEKK